MPHLLGQAPLRVKRVEPVGCQGMTRPHPVRPKVVDCRQAAAAVHLAHRLAAVVQEVRARPRRVLLPCPLPVPIVAAGQDAAHLRQPVFRVKSEHLAVVIITVGESKPHNFILLII